MAQKVYPLTQTAAVRSEGTRAYELLGGKRTLRADCRNALDAHDLLMRGLPPQSLLHLISSVGFLARDEALGAAIGVSVRTLQRRKAGGTNELLSTEQSSRTWRFAEILGQAIDVLGSKDEAEAWMNRPATGLSNRRPIELLATAAGAEAVEDYLTRIEFGVHV